MLMINKKNCYLKLDNCLLEIKNDFECMPQEIALTFIKIHI